MKALIIENNSSFAEKLKSLLGEKSITSFVFNSSSEAETWARGNDFDILITNTFMPDGQSVEVFKRLSEQKTTSLCLISPFLDKASTLKGMPSSLASRIQFFKKPLDEAGFKVWLKSLLEGEAESSQSPLIKFFLQEDLVDFDLKSHFPVDKPLKAEDFLFLTLLCHLKRFTGKLLIPPNIQVEFQRGFLKHVSSVSGESFFGNILVDQGLVVSHEIEACLNNKEDSLRIGERLIEKELIHPHIIQVVLKEQIKIRLSEIMSLDLIRVQIKEEEEGSIETEEGLNKTDFLSFLADSLKTEIRDEFFLNTYEEIKGYKIKKQKPIKETLIKEKNFITSYNDFFSLLEEKSLLSTAIPKTGKLESLRLLFFGLLRKSLVLEESHLKIKPLTPVKSDDEKKNLVEKILSLSDDTPLLILKASKQDSDQKLNRKKSDLLKNLHPDNFDTQWQAKAQKAFVKVTQAYQKLTNKEEILKQKEDEKKQKFLHYMKLYEKGISLLKAQNYKESFKALSQIEDPRAVSKICYLYKIWAHLKISNTSLGQSEKIAIQKELEATPIKLRVSPLFYFVKGLFFYRVKQLEKAKEFFKKSLGLKKNFMEAQQELMLVRKDIRKKEAEQNSKNSSFLDRLLKKA